MRARRRRRRACIASALLLDLLDDLFSANARRWARCRFDAGPASQKVGRHWPALARCLAFDGLPLFLSYYITTVAQLLANPGRHRALVFVRRRPNVFDAGPKLYRCWLVLCVCRDAGSYSTRSVTCIYRHILPCHSLFAGLELGQNWQLWPSSEPVEDERSWPFARDWVIVVSSYPDDTTLTPTMILLFILFIYWIWLFALSEHDYHDYGLTMF